MEKQAYTSPAISVTEYGDVLMEITSTNEKVGNQNQLSRHRGRYGDVWGDENEEDAYP